jgi:hypothetical protein
MFLKNYTSNVPVSETVHRIEKVLIRCGVAGIAKEYVGTCGKIAALTFKLEAPSGPIAIRIPVDVDKALDALWLDYADGDKLSSDGNSIVWSSRKKKRKQDFVEQAERTAWKIMQDWIEVQLSMIQMRQAEALQVFLPYVHDGKRTFYQSLVESGSKGLLPERTGE